MRILGIDTATERAVAGILDGGMPRGERFSDDTGGHARVLLSLIDGCLADAGVALGDLDRIAVSVGPGTFTGLRIGLSTAQGLALATGVPVVGVPTLAALAEAWGETGVVCPLLDARRGEVYSALYRRSAVGLECLMEARVVPVDRFAEEIALPPGAVLAGSGVEVHGTALEARLGAGMHLRTGLRASGVAVARLGAGVEACAVMPDDFVPEYVREPDAVRQRLRSPGGEDGVNESLHPGGTV